ALMQMELLAIPQAFDGGAETQLSVRHAGMDEQSLHTLQPAGIETAPGACGLLAQACIAGA
ncbi:hypothetical protein ACI6Q5_06985, partial [Xanthomonas codiaei]